MNTIKFFIPGKPKAKQRPRFARIGNFTKAYTPKETIQYENWIRMMAAKHAPEIPYEGAVEMNVKFLFPRPKSTKKNILFHTKKPDADNLYKSVADALNDLFYKDDSQICIAKIRKYYSDEQPGVSIEIVYLEDQTPK